MNAVTFDTHAFVKRLSAAGMPEPQAEVLAEEQSRLIDTFCQVGHFRAMSTMIAEMYDALIAAGAPEEKARAAAVSLSEDSLATKRDIAEAKSDILKRTIGAMTVQAVIIIAVVKLL